MSKYLPYHKESREYAKTLTKDEKDPMKKYRMITDWVSKNFVYDYIRAAKIPKKGGLPDLEHIWTTKMGICLDTASMTTGMLKAVGLKAVLCFGYANKAWHAWVETTIDGKKYRYDHDAKSGKTITYQTKYRF